MVLCGGQPSVTYCISGGGDRVGLDPGGKRQGSIHSTRFRPKGQGQLRAVGWKRGRQLFSGGDRLKYCSVLTRQTWKNSIKLAVLGVGWGEKSEPAFSVGEGQYWGTDRQWGRGREDYTALGWHRRWGYLDWASPWPGQTLVSVKCSHLDHKE